MNDTAANRSPAGIGSSFEDSAVGSRFVQNRVALFGKVVFCFAAAFLGMGLVLHVTGVQPFFAAGRESHLAITFTAFAVWQLGRQARTLSPFALKLLDGVGSLMLSVGAVMMGHRWTLGAEAHWGYFAATVSVFHIVLARAILVPSTPRRTLVVTALAFAALQVSQQLSPSFETPWVSLMNGVTLGCTGTALATVASKVIYGLHKEVRQARQLGQYTLEEKIGEGGMGEVYRARHAMLRRPTAIKLLGSNVTERELRRFEKEVQLTAQLTHPNTISIYDYGRTPDGTFYYVMELLDGVTLQDLVEQYGPQPAARVIHILLQACAALREAHAEGLIHRDIKPDNIFLCRQGGLRDVVKLLDFGLVKQIADTVDASHSNVNVMVGTPLYMSPEAIAAPEKLDAQTDVYALGAVAYFLLSGTPVFPSTSVVEVCGHHLHTKPEPPSKRIDGAIPSDLERIVLACLAKDPQARPRGADKLARMLRDCSDAEWSESHAEAWWQTHAQPASAPAAAPLALRTVEVALEDRFPSRGA